MKQQKRNPVARLGGRDNGAKANSTIGYSDSYSTSPTCLIQDKLSATITDAPRVEIKKGLVVTNSLDIAKKFNKRHDNVCAAVKRIFKSRPDFGLLNFKESSYANEQNKRHSLYEITRSGFSILAMGFTGEKALDWKIKYEAAFCSMEQVLLHQANPAWQELRDQGKATRIEATDTIKDFIDYAIRQGSQNAKYYYRNITNTTYKALFLISYKSPKNFRDLLDNMQLSFLQTAEYVAINALKDGMASNIHYKEIFKLCKVRLQAFAENVGVTPVINDNVQMQFVGNA